MALFDNIGIGDIIGGIGAVGGLIGAFSGGPEVPGAVKKSAKMQFEIAQALANPDSEMFQRIMRGEEGRIRRDYAYALDQMSRANRRAVARTGGLGFINPERRDETVSSTVKRGFVDAKDTARASTRAYLQAAMGANSAVAGAYQPIMAAQQAGAQQRAGGFEALLDLGEYIGGGRMLNGDPGMTITLPREWGPSVHGLT